MMRVLVVEPHARERQRLNACLAATFAVEGLADLPRGADLNIAAFDAVVANPRLPSGVDPIAAAGAVPVILVPADASVPAAVRAMRRGAADYLAQPAQQRTLLDAVQRAIARATPARPSRSGEHAPPLGRWPLYGGCGAMLELFAQIRAAAATNAPALIEGEPGTGKELVASALHAAGRSGAPMTTLDCAAVPEAAIASELFGFAHAGALGPPATGLVDAARGGTLFINEVGDLPPPAQARLVELLRDGIARPVNGIPRAVDVRVVAATRQDMDQLAESRRFRTDLLALLRTVRLVVPPLRERGDDIPRLAEILAGRAAARLNKPLLRFSAKALAAICAYGWPGNVSELENIVERAAILCERDEIDATLLAIDVGVVGADPPAAADIENGLSLEGYFVRFVVEHQDHFTETELAARLGISRKSLWERRKRHGIPRRRTRKRGHRSARS